MPQSHFSVALGVSTILQDGMCKTMAMLPKRRTLKEKHKDLIFYCLMMAFPVLQFLVFYIGVNFNSILLAFQDIDLLAGTKVFTLQNIRDAFQQITQSPALLAALRTSLVAFVIIMCISTPLALLFSYYIYKKQPGHGIFRVILFLPSILSAIVMVAIFQAFVERAIPSASKLFFGADMLGLLENVDTRFVTLMFYNVWFGFGTNVLLYTNAMSGISPEVVESAHLDGAVGLKEFLHISLPMIWPTLVTFVVVNVAGIFVNQLNLFSFYGAAAPEGVQTYGYYLYKEVQTAKSEAEYPILSAIGLLLTLVAVPLTMGIRRLLEKCGPKEE